MGTDSVELLDRRTAEIIIHGTHADLIAVVESRTHPLAGPPVWRKYADPSGQSMQEFPRSAAVDERLQLLASSGRAIADIKRELIEELCTSDWLNLDYWGCMAALFNGDPPGSTTWEDFVAPMYRGAPPQPVNDTDDVLWDQTSGRYLLTCANTESMIVSLRNHLQDVHVMGEADIAKLERWHAFCTRHPGFCVVYQQDF